MRRWTIPIVAAAIALAGSLAATLALHRAAAASLGRVLEERLRGAGESAALLLGDARADPAKLRRLMAANGLDAAYVLDRSLAVLADASGRAGGRADLLRVDPERVEQAFSGVASVGTGYALGELEVATAYFPIPAADGSIAAVLALEAGQTFLQARRGLSRALGLGVALSAVGALALAVVAARWSRAEQERREARERAARGQALSRMAAMAAHDIRNPLSVIRGTVELLRERSGAVLSGRDRAALDDVLGEVERLQRLTEDLLDLTAERTLSPEPVELGEALEEAARAAEAAFPGTRVRVEAAGALRLHADPARLRQVLGNLLANAAQARPQGEIVLTATARAGRAAIQVRDFGPGIPADVRTRLFDPFVTSKPGGTGLGLVIARRFAELHGGGLRLVETGPDGTTFELELPLEQAARAGRGQVTDGE